MLRLASDADVHGDIVRGLRLRQPIIDLVRAQDAFPQGTPDPEILAWAAAENRILITNDRNTMVGLAYHRVAAGKPVPGLIATTNQQSIGLAIDDILLIAEYMPAEEIRTKSSSSCPFGVKLHCYVGLQTAPGGLGAPLEADGANSPWDEARVPQSPQSPVSRILSSPPTVKDDGKTRGQPGDQRCRTSR